MSKKMIKGHEKCKLLDSGEMRLHVIYSLGGKYTLRDAVTLSKEVLEDAPTKKIIKTLQEYVEVWVLAIKAQAKEAGNV